MTLIDQLTRILNSSYNAYTFQYRCKGLHIMIERMPDGVIEAYYADDRSGRVAVDVTQEPFSKLLKWLYK